jgi:ABC-type molybdenum transport system ATPase subunit/photorepair protein PhrA
LIGKVLAPGVTGQLGYTVLDALRHTWVIGPNGTGKSTLLLNLIDQDLHAGPAGGRHRAERPDPRPADPDSGEPAG